MTPDRKDLIGLSFGMHEYDTGVRLAVEKAFDITEYFKGIKPADRVTLAYAQSSMGEWAHLVTNNGEDLMSTGTGLFIRPEDVENEIELPTDSVRRYAKMYGIHPDLLAEIIMTHATHQETD